MSNLPKILFEDVAAFIEMTKDPKATEEDLHKAGDELIESVANLSIRNVIEAMDS